MSRRHKETESENIKPHQAESHEDVRLSTKSNEKSTSNVIFSGIGKYLKFTVTATRYLTERITQTLGTTLGTSTFEIDDKWVQMKIPRSSFDDYDIQLLQQYNAHVSHRQEERTRKGKGGRNPINRLFRNITDNMAAQFFLDTWNAVKEKCIEMYEGVAQCCVCFFKAASRVFSPEDDDDSYGKREYYHSVLVKEIPELPTTESLKEKPVLPVLKTLNNWFKWFEEWKPAVTYEDRKAKKERARHRLWDKLIDWVQKYLMDLAPEYAVAN